MLFVAISHDIKKRKQAITQSVATIDGSDKFFFDDSSVSLKDLSEYIYPSLFSVTVPVVSGLFLLEAHSGELEQALLLELVQSPTIFILEEYALSAVHKKALQKAGAKIILEEVKKNITKNSSPLFSAVTVICTSSDRKEKWLTLQKVLLTESPEALIGMLYWKLRDLSQKDHRKKMQYLQFYQKLLHSHAEAWQQNVPLALLLEKIVLQK